MVMIEPSFKYFSRFFFKAMLQGYAGGVKALPIANSLPGWKGYDIRDSSGEYRLIDMYHGRKETGHSAGNTTVWKNDEAIFYMTYGGQYPSEVGPFLKEALFVAYEKRRVDLFFRGPELFQSVDHPGLTYLNMFGEGNQGFKHFWGREHIVGSDNRELGYHTYEGWWWHKD